MMPQLPGTRRLDVVLRDVGDEILQGVAVKVAVPAARTSPRNDLSPPVPGGQVVGGTVTRHTNVDGQTHFYLYPSQYLEPAGTYAVSWQGQSPLTFSMPDRDTSLYELLTS